MRMSTARKINRGNDQREWVLFIFQHVIRDIRLLKLYLLFCEVLFHCLAGEWCRFSLFDIAQQRK